jgi:heme/copper-type cytochrome/quinol oxidase subunit 2
MDSNIASYMILLVFSLLFCLAGTIAAIVFFIMARSQTDSLKKKKYDRIAIWSFIGPILIVVIGRFISSVIYYSTH